MNNSNNYVSIFAFISLFGYFFIPDFHHILSISLILNGKLLIYLQFLQWNN